MRLALVSATVFGGFLGGVTNHIRFMARELRSRGHELALFKPVWDSECSECMEEERNGDISIAHVNLGRRPYDFRRWSGISRAGAAASALERVARSLSWKPLVRAVETWNPDLVWQHDFSSTWIAVRRLSRKYPVVLTNHLGEYLMLNEHTLGRLLLPRLLNHYSAIIAPSRELTPHMRGAYTVHNGVDLSQFQVPTAGVKAELKHRLFGTDARWVVFCPRRLSPTKGVIYLAQAIREMDGNPSVRESLLFVLAGTDYAEYPKYVEAINNTLDGLSIPVVKLGNVPISQMNVHYQASDLVVIPSLMEAVSLSALEAMATGVPVLSTNVGGMPEIIVHGVNGYLVSPASAPELRDMIMWIRDDPDRDRVAARALDMVRANYSWTAIADRTEQILLSALSAAHQ